MSEPIKNRYDFVILFDVENGNPNGDPDAGNMPRIDPETGYGLVTDVCLKRKIRNYVETLKEDEKGYRIYIKDGVPLNRSDAEAISTLGIDPDLKAAKKADPDIDAKLRDYMCENYFDIRTFGAVTAVPLAQSSQQTALGQTAQQFIFMVDYRDNAAGIIIHCIDDLLQGGVRVDRDIILCDIFLQRCRIVLYLLQVLQPDNPLQTVFPSAGHQQ